MGGTDLPVLDYSTVLDRHTHEDRSHHPMEENDVDQAERHLEHPSVKVPDMGTKKRTDAKRYVEL